MTEKGAGRGGVQSLEAVVDADAPEGHSPWFRYEDLAYAPPRGGALAGFGAALLSGRPRGTGAEFGFRDRRRAAVPSHSRPDTRTPGYFSFVSPGPAPQLF